MCWQLKIKFLNLFLPSLCSDQTKNSIMSCGDNGISDAQSTAILTTIEQLCDDILLEVFEYLNVKNLKNASLVSKRWNESTQRVE